MLAIRTLIFFVVVIATFSYDGPYCLMQIFIQAFIFWLMDPDSDPTIPHNQNHHWILIWIKSTLRYLLTLYMLLSFFDKSVGM